MTDLRTAVQKRAARVTATRITLDDINAKPRYNGRMTVQTDNGQNLTIETVGYENGKVIGFARSPVTNIIARFEQTGSVLQKGWAFRVKIAYGEDTGDMAGTLAFGDGVSQGGWINEGLVWEARGMKRPGTDGRPS